MADKILFVASTFSHLRNFHLPYLQAFRDRGWEVHAAAGGAEMPLPPADRLISLPLQKSMFSPENFRAASELRKLIQQEGYRLISVHTSLAAFFTRISLKGLRSRPAVLNVVHGYLFDDTTPSLKRTVLLTAEKLTAPETDVLAVMNKYDYKLAQREKLGKHLTQIPGMGVDFSRLDRCTVRDGYRLRQQYRIPLASVMMLYPAEFSKRKNQAALIQAAAQLPPLAYLALPGEGALREECMALAKKLGIESRVIFPGQIEDMAPWFAAADVAVSVSRSEGLPFNIIEAMHCGLPVVASRVKGHTDLVEPERTGLLFDLDNQHDLVHYLQVMLDPSIRQRFGAAGAARAVQFGLDEVFPQVMALYETALETAKVPAPL